MISAELPAPIASYFSSKDPTDAEQTFAQNATVYDNGEDLELKGIEAIRQWLTGRVAAYDLTSQLVSYEQRGDEHVVGVIVSGKFPGSPYKFENRFRLTGEQILELAIDPIGSLAD
ncbi:MAG: nuclear transport factor 2 family protein [Fimbriimonas sp.]